MCAPTPLDVADDLSQKDRQEIHRRVKEEVLQTGHCPTIVYECSRVWASGTDALCWASLKGELTLRGVTRSVPISAKVVLDGNSL